MCLIISTSPHPLALHPVTHWPSHSLSCLKKKNTCLHAFSFESATWSSLSGRSGRGLLVTLVIGCTGANGQICCAVNPLKWPLMLLIPHDWATVNVASILIPSLLKLSVHHPLACSQGHRVPASSPSLGWGCVGPKTRHWLYHRGQHSERQDTD